MITIEDLRIGSRMEIHEAETGRLLYDGHICDIVGDTVYIKDRDGYVYSFMNKDVKNPYYEFRVIQFEKDDIRSGIIIAGVILLMLAVGLATYLLS